MDYNRPKRRGQNENTTELRKCIRNFVFRSHSGTDLCACLWPVGESPDRQNSEGAWWQAQSLRAGATISRWPSGPVRSLGIRRRQVHPRHCGGSQTRRRAIYALGQSACRATRRRLAFGRGSPCKLPAPRRPEDQCLAPTVEGDPKSDIIAILYESDNAWRQIFLDGRELGNDFPPTFLGYSTGKWDGDTLVVDTRGFNGKTWLDQTGKPTSDALHVTERFRRTDFGHMEIQITLDDPKVYTKPWQVKEQVRLVTDYDVIESACENNVDLRYLGGKFTR